MLKEAQLDTIACVTCHHPIGIITLFQSDAASGTSELRQLLEETFDLVEQHLPQVDLKQQRETFNRLNPKWKLPVSG